MQELPAVPVVTVCQLMAMEHLAHLSRVRSGPSSRPFSQHNCKKDWPT